MYIVLYFYLYIPLLYWNPIVHKLAVILNKIVYSYLTGAVQRYSFWRTPRTGRTSTCSCQSRLFGASKRDLSGWGLNFHFNSTGFVPGSDLPKKIASVITRIQQAFRRLLFWPDILWRWELLAAMVTSSSRNLGSSCRSVTNRKVGTPEKMEWGFQSKHGCFRPRKRTFLYRYFDWHLCRYSIYKIALISMI